jgi:signal transduction histidine kinase
MSGLLHDLLHFFDSTELSPHGVCLLWQPGLIWLHVISDGIIALAYFSIPIVLAVIVSKRPDIDFGWVLWAFVAFITACGTTHVFGIWTLWFPDYAEEGAVKGLTAFVSILTAIGLWPLLPKILALPSPEQLRRANAQLQRQVTERDAALRALEQEKSERFKAEELLRSVEQNREIERLVAVTPDAVIVADTDGIVRFANEAAVSLFGRGSDRLVGNPMPFPVRSGELQGIDVPGRGAHAGEVRLADCQWGDAPARLVVVRDITERKRVERLKDEFVSTVSHELRTPITSIVGSLGLLVGKAAGSLPEPAARLLAIALKNSQRLTQLVNEILDISKMESGESAFRLRSMDVRTVAEQAIEGIRGFATSYAVDVRLVNSAATSQEVYADPDRLMQVVTNLLSNAIKFSPPGREVHVLISRMGADVRISVRDWGPGIPDSFKPQIFEKFAQADASDARQRGGSGLGLNIVKHIVTRLGGRVSFEDAAGGGTMFHVDLPHYAEPVRSAGRVMDAKLAMNLAS